MLWDEDDEFHEDPADADADAAVGDGDRLRREDEVAGGPNLSDRIGGLRLRFKELDGLPTGDFGEVRCAADDVDIGGGLCGGEFGGNSGGLDDRLGRRERPPGGGDAVCAPRAMLAASRAHVSAGLTAVEEGEDDGESDGVDDGLALGPREGCADGSELGDDVGKPDGELDGEEVGNLDGESVGALVALAKHLPFFHSQHLTPSFLALIQPIAAVKKMSVQNPFVFTNDPLCRTTGSKYLFPGASAQLHLKA